TAVIGVGEIGGATARNLVSGGERVVVAARDEGHAAELAQELGKLASAAPVHDAISQADAVALAVWFEVAENLVPEYEELLDGKVVIDPTNPLARDESGVPLQRDGGYVRNLPEDVSASSIIAGLVPAGAHYVKAFGTLVAADLASGSNRAPERVALLYASDDHQAVAEAERLISAAGFDPVNAGGVDDAGRIELPGGDLFQYGSAFDGRPPTATQARTAIEAVAQAA
ncbi:MAG: NADPH-dependent F420 reductase, partial [Propionibacteriaceae bacterium]